MKSQAMGVSVSQADSRWGSPVSIDCYLDNTLESSEKGISDEKLPPSDWFVGMSVGHVLDYSLM